MAQIAKPEGYDFGLFVRQFSDRLVTFTEAGDFLECADGDAPSLQILVDTYNPAQELARQEEVTQAPLTARQWFVSHQAAIDFIRLTPEEQETQIDAMTTAQLKTLLKFVTVAVSALIKKEFLQ